MYMYMYVTQPSQLSCLSSSAGWLGEGMCVRGVEGGRGERSGEQLHVQD